MWYSLSVAFSSTTVNLVLSNSYWQGCKKGDNIFLSKENNVLEWLIIKNVIEMGQNAIIIEK